jgi:hypothetical protein
MSGKKSNRDRETPDENGHLKGPAVLAVFKTCASHQGLQDGWHLAGHVLPLAHGRRGLQEDEAAREQANW